MPRQHGPDTLAILDDALDDCEASIDKWLGKINPPTVHRLTLAMGEDGSFGLTDWSISQLYKLADVSKDTLNKLSPDTAIWLSAKLANAGDRSEADAKASALLVLAA